MNPCQITTDDTLRETAQHGSPTYPFAYYPENIWQFDFHRIGTGIMNWNFCFSGRVPPFALWERRK